MEIWICQVRDIKGNINKKLMIISYRIGMVEIEMEEKEQKIKRS